MAYRQAQEIRGQADAEAARIYADAYGQDAEFYQFSESLSTLKDTLPPGALEPHAPGTRL